MENDPVESVRRILLPPFAFMIMLFNIAFSLGIWGRVESMNEVYFLVIVFLFFGVTFGFGVLSLTFLMFFNRPDKVVLKNDFYLSFPLALLSMVLREENRESLFSPEGVFAVFFLILMWFGSIRIMRIGFQK